MISFTVSGKAFNRNLKILYYFIIKYDLKGKRITFKIGI